MLAAPGPAWAQGRSWTEARNKMVDEEIVGAGVKNPRVIDAMRKTPRHEFVPLRDRAHAYLDMALPIGEGQTISPPFIVAYMTEAIDPQPTDVVLEIGTGSGYQAAVLSPLVREVYTIEIVPALGHRAEKTLQRLGYGNVHVKVGDGYQGWPEHAPFDKIIVTCSPEQVPPELVAELKEGGRMVIPVGQRYQQTLYLLKKTKGKMVSETLLPTLFVPMTGAAEEKRKVQPDPLHPSLENGDFEKVAGDPPQPVGWHYVRQLTVVSDGQSPSGKNYVSFRNQRAGPRLPGPAGIRRRWAEGRRNWTSRWWSAAAKSAPVKRPRSFPCWASPSTTRTARRSARRGPSAPGSAASTGGPRRSGSRSRSAPARPSSASACSARWASFPSTTSSSKRPRRSRIERSGSSRHDVAQDAQPDPAPAAGALAPRRRFAGLDALDRWRGRADDLTPPRSLQAFVGGGFQALGEEFFAYFKDLCRLRPDETVLDVGCGSGRMAVPLLGYLDRRGRYVGFDIAPKLIRWCSGHITRRNANFTFHLADIFNRHYNPRGACPASAVPLPRGGPERRLRLGHVRVHAHAGRRHAALSPRDPPGAPARRPRAA